MIDKRKQPFGRIGARWRGNQSNQRATSLTHYSRNFEEFHQTLFGNLLCRITEDCELLLPVLGFEAGRLGLRAEVPLDRGIFTYSTRDGSERGLFEMKPVTAALDAALIVQL